MSKRVEQWGVSDRLATPEQLAARKTGVYDPRDASGPHVALRVKVRCARCGQKTGEVHDFEKRILYRSMRDKRWYMSLSAARWKCTRCFDELEPITVDADVLQQKLDRAREDDTPTNVKVGAMSE